MGCGKSTANSSAVADVSSVVPPSGGKSAPASPAPHRDEQRPPSRSVSMSVSAAAAAAAASPGTPVRSRPPSRDGRGMLTPLLHSPAASNPQSPDALLSSRRCGGTANDPLLLSHAPAGSQISGQNYCAPDFFPLHMEEVFQHYARPSEYEWIEKRGLHAMAADCVDACMAALSAKLLLEHPKMHANDIKKWEKRLAEERVKHIPGRDLQECYDIAKFYLAQELKFQEKGISKACFFLHFPRAYRNLFTGGKITLEHETLVDKLNKQHVERLARGLTSVKAHKSTAMLASAKMHKSMRNIQDKKKGTASVMAPNKHKEKDEKHKDKDKHKKEKKANIFGDVDFD